MKKEILKINPNDFKDRMFTSSEIGRGIGIQKAKKGKGSYTRKRKHKSCYSTEGTITALVLILFS